MKVVVFGATGKLGRVVVRKLLEEGHSVTAFARRPERLAISEPNLKLVAGNALNLNEAQSAVAGQDAVVIALGSGMTRRSLIRSQGTLAILQAMHREGVRRLICQSTLGAHESWENLNFFWKYVMFGALLRPVFLDHQRQEELVRASGLDWTIVRPAAFDDDPATGSYRENFAPDERNLSLKISLGDIADFVARQLPAGGYLRQAVGISN